MISGNRLLKESWITVFFISYYRYFLNLSNTVLKEFTEMYSLLYLKICNKL